jgi:hypothetical protein
LSDRVAVDHATLDSLGDGLLCLVTSPRVWVVVYPGMSGELVGSRELLCASRKLARVRLLSRMRPDVSGLMLEAMEGFVAKRTLVRSWQVLSVLPMLAPDHGGHHADRGHFCFSLFLFYLFELLSRRLLLGLQLRLRIE